VGGRRGYAASLVDLAGDLVHKVGGLGVVYRGFASAAQPAVDGHAMTDGAVPLLETDPLKVEQQRLADAGDVEFAALRDSYEERGPPA